MIFFITVKISILIRGTGRGNGDDCKSSKTGQVLVNKNQTLIK